MSTPRGIVEPLREWTEAMNDRLRALWVDGVYLSEISRRMHIPKQTIQRQVRALGLPIRPNPVRPASRPKRAKPVPHGASTLPPLPSQLEDA
jgi:hypothetical protein